MGGVFQSDIACLPFPELCRGVVQHASFDTWTLVTDRHLFGDGDTQQRSLVGELVVEGVLGDRIAQGQARSTLPASTRITQ